ncbi:MAG: class I SAM-dependent methyltransferase [Saprospiraceae bacterium]|mgnify:CR=1 FL=1
MTSFWDERYSDTEFVYGKDPNVFFAENLDLFQPGSKLFFPAEGEGRNAVFAAENGCEVLAWDQSEAARNKAMLLASERKVDITYLVGDWQDLHFANQRFDAIILIYAHFPSSIRNALHSQLVDWLKPGGLIVFEAFSKDQLKYESGGPKSADMLFNEEEVLKEFSNLKFKTLRTEIIDLKEGKYHVGKGSVVRFVAIKP